MVREAKGLSANETSWLQNRRNKIIKPMADFLERMNISGFDARSYIRNNAHNISSIPKIATAIGGGRSRAMLNGAGAFKAWDSREFNTTAAGQLEGLVQAATYVAGLSGGNWFVGSIFINNFTTVESCKQEATLRPSSSLTTPPTKDRIEEAYGSLIE